MPVPWLGYIPIPGLQFVPVLVAPDDRLSRFHAWQSGAVVGLLLFGLLALGFLRGPLPPGARAVVDGFAGVLALVGLVWSAWGLVGAARGRYTRLPGVAALLTAIGK